jgi:AraC family ethanolamine operon transcriptional activator
MNIVRKAFYELDNCNPKTADIANLVGFWHMGQFAKDYRKLFAELPSETIKKIRI